jgi:hypothetical protein
MNFPLMGILPHRYKMAVVWQQPSTAAQLWQHLSSRNHAVDTGSYLGALLYHFGRSERSIWTMGGRILESFCGYREAQCHR